MMYTMARKKRARGSDISQGSVATRLTFGEIFPCWLYFRFTVDCRGDWILKVDQEYTGCWLDAESAFVASRVDYCTARRDFTTMHSINLRFTYLLTYLLCFLRYPVTVAPALHYQCSLYIPVMSVIRASAGTVWPSRIPNPLTFGYIIVYYTTKAANMHTQLHVKNIIKNKNKIKSIKIIDMQNMLVHYLVQVIRRL